MIKILPPVSVYQLYIASETLPDINLNMSADISNIVSDLNKSLIENSDSYELLPEVGFVKIIDHIPNRNHPKALKISLPGIEYNQKTKEFDFPKLYLIEKQSWLFVRPK